jgi:hypothetical protein
MTKINDIVVQKTLVTMSLQCDSNLELIPETFCYDGRIELQLWNFINDITELGLQISIDAPQFLTDMRDCVKCVEDNCDYFIDHLQYERKKLLTLKNENPTYSKEYTDLREIYQTNCRLYESLYTNNIRSYYKAAKSIINIAVHSLESTDRKKKRNKRNCECSTDFECN